jgi:NAD(P)-dependent dehydrogenase (short-subunit alcohol dehydrogenase family)
LSNNVLVIVGSGGMGAAIAHRLGSGRTIVLFDVNSQNLDAATHALVANGHDVHGVTVDVTSPRSVTDLAAYGAALGPVTGVVHTAGVSPEQADIDTIPHVDLVGVALVLEQFGEVIEAGGVGVVIAGMAGHFHPAMDQGVEHELGVPRRGICWRSRRVLPHCSTSRKRPTLSPGAPITFGSPLRHPHGASAGREATRSAPESSQRQWECKNSAAARGR